MAIICQYKLDNIAIHMANIGFFLRAVKMQISGENGL